MSWQDLLREEISTLEKDMESAKKKLEKAVSEGNLSKTLEYTIKIENCKFAVRQLYVCIGKGIKVTSLDNN